MIGVQGLGVMSRLIKDLLLRQQESFDAKEQRRKVFELSTYIRE